MSVGSEAHFDLNPRLAADTAFVADWKLCRVLLMDDTRFAWLVLVPRRAGLNELDDLDPANRARLTVEIDQAMRLLRATAPCDKLNVGALGNIVRQLHIHVIARRAGDAAWPGPVWGSGPPPRYPATQRNTLVSRLRKFADF